MIRIAYHRFYVQPLPEGHRFPMLKYDLIPGQLLYEGVAAPRHFFEPEVLTEDIVLQTHQADYWASLRDQTMTAAGQRRLGFPLDRRLVERELRIAKGTIEGAVFAIENGIAFNVAGGTHHAGSSWGEGFCLLNDQAIAANYLLSHGLAKRILIIDLDVHQGNGTAEIFREEPRVFTFSMHGDKNFPFRKEQSDLDIPLADGTEDEEYLSILGRTLPELLIKHRPDFIFYLSGVDVLATDKLGKLSLSPEGCKERDRMVLQFCRDHRVPVQVSMGGGYSPDIRHIVNAHSNTFKLAFELFT